MIRNVLMICALVFSTTDVLADCDIVSKFNINVNIEPIKYDYSKKSSEIEKIAKKQFNNEYQYILGSYIPVLSIGLNYKSIAQKSFGKTCNKVVSMNVELKLESTIFIAKEIQPFSCTLNRTIKHESQHFNFQKEAIDFGVSYLKNNMEPVFSQKIYTSPSEYAQNMRNQLDLFQKNTLRVIENSADKKHNFIDSHENYKKESKLCSESEQRMIGNTILTFEHSPT